jgi:hypothetical protein
MFKKEFANVLKQTGWFVAAALALSVALLAVRLMPRQPYFAVFLSVFQWGLLFWALFLGASVLARERSQRALEYVLTLPYSRLGLLLRLTAPRLIVLGGLWALSLCAYVLKGNEYSAVDPLFLAFLYIGLFVTSLSLSPIIENFIALCLSSIFVWFLAFPAFTYLLIAVAWAKGFQLLPGAGAMGLGFLRNISYGSAGYIFNLLILQIVLLAFPFSAALILSFRKFDARPSAAFAKKYFKTLGLSILIFAAAAFVMTFLSVSMRFRDVYLTPDHKVVEFQSGGARILSPEGIRKFKTPYPVSWVKSADGIHFVFSDYGNNLSCLDAAIAEVRTIYQAANRDRGIWQFWPYDGKVVFLVKPDTPIVISLADIDKPTSAGSNVTTIPFPAEWARSERFPRLFGTGVNDGRHFWLFYFEQSKKPPLRLWENGRVEGIPLSDNKPLRSALYVNDMVIIDTAEETKIFQDRGISFELVREIKDGISFSLYDLDARVLDQPRAEVIYGKHGDKIAKLDLKALQVNDIAPLKTAHGAWVASFFPESFLLIEMDSEAKTLKVSSICDDKVKLLREFRDFDFRRQGDRFDVQKSGIIIHRKGTVSVYAFPDLLEIKF